jgi:hypothetical protein
MKRKGVEGLPADPQESLAANDEFADSSDGYAHLTQSRSGWDPYDVWLTRVKNSSRAQERDTDSRR